MIKGITKRAKSISPSPTLALDARIKKLRSQGVSVISFGVGEPDFDTPENIKLAAKKAIDEGFTKYTPAHGTDSLRLAVCNRYKRDYGVQINPNNIVISNGAKHSLFNIAMALYEEGDEVIIPSPYWVSYPEQVIIMGAKPVFINTSIENDFKITVEQLEDKITKHTKALIINTPSNPTGMIYSREDLLSILNVIEKHDIFIICDEIYDALIYDNKHFTCLLQLLEDKKELKKRVIVVNGVSKSYAMTGWRIGYLIADEPVAKVISDIQSQSTSNPCSISQRAAEEALNGSQDEVKNMLKNFEKRKNLIVSLLSEINNVKVKSPHGSFYVFPDFSYYVGKCKGSLHIQNTVKLCEYLLEEAKVGIVPGEAFGAPGFVRFSFATSEKNIKEGIERVKKALYELV